MFSIPVGVIYRPNEAKVKNLKTKDYLGKARLIAASDRNNAFTGFQGSELKRAATVAERALDDRPAENISYAATNLVQKNLTSRARQQSEPPIARNTFPPTPPPDSDKGAPTSSNGSSAGGSGLTGRAASVRAGPPPRLDLERPGATNGRTGGDMPSMEKLRIGRTRTASASRVPASRQYATARGQGRDAGRQPYYRDPASRRGLSESGFTTMNEEVYSDDVYDLYISPRSVGNSNRRAAPRQQQYIDEEDEYASDVYEDDIIEDGEFEIMGAPRTRALGGDRIRARGGSRKPDIRKFRVKVHAADDIRYIMIGPTIDFAEFEGRIRGKFGFRSRLKIRMRDEGDMITMGDQDDLDLLLSSAKDAARKEGSDMAKMEVCTRLQKFHANYRN